MRVARTVLPFLGVVGLLLGTVPASASETDTRAEPDDPRASMSKQDRAAEEHRSM